MFCNIELMALNLFGVPLARSIGMAGKTWCAYDGIHCQLETVDVVQHTHIEGRSGSPFFLIAAHMNVVVIGTAISKPVNQVRIAVKCKDHGLVLGEDGVEIAITESVRMVRLRLQRPE